MATPTDPDMVSQQKNWMKAQDDIKQPSIISWGAQN